jgi:choline dehydrogenase-like flavoprotein
MQESPDIWDAIVVGSGATGGAAAWKLTARGKRVLVLEAGKPTSPSEHRPRFLRNSATALWRHWTGRQHTQRHHPTYWATNPDFFVDDVANPYSTPDDMPFRWIRGGRVGGRTLTWDAVTPRLSDFEFKAASDDGFGIDWPICHDDLDPYYAELETLFDVFGTREGLPQLPDGVFSGQKQLTPGELHFKKKAEAYFGDRRVIVSRGVNAERSPEKGAHFSKITSIRTTLQRALDTGLLTIRANARAAKVLVEGTRERADGVEWIDTQTGEVHRARAKLVFLCASTIESVRILLNSRTSAHAQGLGGNSGHLGHYLMDHSAGNVYFTLPDVREDGGPYEFSGCASILVPRYQNLGQRTHPYLRGFGIWGGIQRMPVPNILRRDRNVAFGFLCGRSEVLPHRENRVELSSTKDRYGVPVPHITCAWKEADVQLAAAARADTEDMVRCAGGVPGMVTDHFYTPFVKDFMRQIQKEWTISTPGMFVHEVGGARMGKDPSESVVDPYCAVWGVGNVFVTDGACWVTSGWQNPTLTEMAITLRACDHALDQVGRW